MRPLSAFPAEAARALRGVVFDLDDTLLDHGALTEVAYGALFRLREAGLRLIACTGRPAGWGEVLLRQWPIDACIVENGALALAVANDSVPTVDAPPKASLRTPFAEGMPRRVLVLDPFTAAERKARRASLVACAEELVMAFPDTALADDNAARITDVTLDIGEHHRVSPADIAAMRALAHARGLRTLASSVHVHLTHEPDDKASGTVRLLGERFGEDATSALGRYAFFGDSGNDAAPFAAFANTFGVANVRTHARSLSVPPRYVADLPMGRGFASIAARIIELRKG